MDKTDVNGLRLGDELARIGYLGEEELGSRNIGAFFEAHIEQGPILEDEEKAIGVVRLGQGIRWYNVEVQGVNPILVQHPCTYAKTPWWRPVKL